MRNDSDTLGRTPRRYPTDRTSPWFFLVVAGATIAFILAGIFHFEPLSKLLHWLAVVL